VRFDASQHLANLIVHGQAALAPGDRLVRTNSLDVDGTLDLADGTMIVDYLPLTLSPVTAIAADLTSGHAGGAWNGPGINSSVAAATPNRALGYAEAVDLGSPPTFAGEPIDSSAVLVRFTLGGDADLSRFVDVADLGALASNWQQSPRRWSHGNFDYSPGGAVDVADLGILASNWQQGISSAPLLHLRHGRKIQTARDLLF
jgi:hypothetical protein